MLSVSPVADATAHTPACLASHGQPRAGHARLRPAAATGPLSRASGSPAARTLPRQLAQSQKPCLRSTSCQAASKEFIEDESFRIEKISFGSILTPIGGALLVYGFGSYFQLLPGSSSGPLLLIYGFPVTLLGFALSYAQLKPVPCKTTPEAMAQRETQCTDILKQVREDVTRYRYGDEQHLDEALGRIFMLGRPKGLPRRLSPRLQAVREEVVDGKYALALEFSSKKKEMTHQMWEDRREKFQTFFGPGVTASVSDTEQGADVLLVVDGSGAGRGGEAQQDVMPPLMPGMKARARKQS